MFSIFLEATDRFIAFFFLGFLLAFFLGSGIRTVIGAFPWSRRLFLTGAFVCFFAFICFFFFAFVCFAFVCFAHIGVGGDAVVFNRGPEPKLEEI